MALLPFIEMEFHQISQSTHTCVRIYPIIIYIILFVATAEDKPLPPLGNEGRLLTLPDSDLDPLAPDAMVPQPKGGPVKRPPQPQQPKGGPAAQGPPPGPSPVAAPVTSSPAGEQAAAYHAAGIVKMEQGRWDEASSHFASAMKAAAAAGRPISLDAQVY